MKNTINNKCYVGLSTYFPSKRFEEHYKDAVQQSSKNYNDALSKAIRKYGINNFIFQVLEECPNDQLDEKEREYILIYDCYKNGYNSTYGGRNAHYDGKYGIEKAKDIIQYIKIHKGVAFVDVAKIFNVPASYISDINCGEVFRMENETYPIINKGNKKFFTKEQLEKIYQDLKDNIKTLTQIANENDVTVQAISYINKGKNYKKSNIKYPIRETKNNKISITQK